MSSEAETTRVRILEAALAHLRAAGDLSFRMQDIAERAGLSRQAIYLHFDGRANLMVELVRFIDEREGLERRARRVWQADSALEALEQFVALQAEYNPRIYPAARLLLQGRYRDQALRAAWQDRMASRRRACRRLVEWLEGDGELGPGWDLEAASDLLWAGTSIQLWEALVHGRGYSPARYREHTSRLLRSGLTAGSEESSGSAGGRRMKR